MITFDDASKKALRFDKSDGIEEGHSFFLDTDVKSELDEKYDTIFVETVFEILAEQKEKPCILFLKEAESTLLSTYERISAFKKEVHAITTPLILIGKYWSGIGKKKN